MKILTAKQMSTWEKRCIRKHHVSSQTLMARAAAACYNALHTLIKTQKKNRVTIICGPGNNGGDGLALAGLLQKNKIAFSCFLLGDPKKFSPEATHFFNLISQKVLPICKEDDFKKLKQALKQSDLIVDALFGIGLSRPLNSNYLRAVKLINATKAFKVAIDIPSGLSASSGEILGDAVRADWTLTFETPKWGHLQLEAWDYVGQLKIVSIALNKAELTKISASGEWIDEKQVQRLLKPRSYRAHKGAAGKVLVIAGSQNMPGAGYLTAMAALRSGAGLVTWAMPEEAFQKIDLKYPEILLKPLPSKNGQFCEASWELLRKTITQFNAIAIGPGWGQGTEAAKFLSKILAQSSLAKIIDADGLNLISKHPELFKKIRNCILTPHPQEMARLTHLDTAQVLEQRVALAKKFSKTYHCWLILKGYRSVIAGPKNQLFINSSGGPNLATAGSGDVLTGILAGLRAQGLSAKAASLSGVFIHGLAGDRLAESLGDRGTIASDLIKALPKVLKELIS